MRFLKIPTEVKKYLYIHNDIYRGMPINKEKNNQKLVEITNNEIKCEPFWNDKIILTGDKEIDDLLFLESKEMADYIQKNGDNFGIFVREEVKDILLKIDKNLSQEEIYDLTTQMISNPDRDVSPHTTGGVVDVVLYDKSGELVDMGCPVNYVGEKANITTNDISEKQRRNREILQDEFLDSGFSCLASEWWHFSYGDPYWAKFYGKNEALFGAI
ncbi:hypothetical protein BKN14_00710 [Candidatus Gracilibacteria bacterium HOT-871]|nr:hypothetical protein BKN14_00710 [Candidatus Gracilibacteria bacterium HOT-871]